MKLSVVIVSYNVRYFLSACLQSVVKALEGIDSEIFVVDNNSPDDSVEMVEHEFPQVKLIANKNNVGFSKANNQAIDLAKGEYILLLNPDTIVAEDCFVKTIHYMDEHQNTGGLGVRMIDGSGKFLPESKRGLPTPSVAFYKIFGMSRIFPKSKVFGKYHLGYLDEFENHEIDVLSGAFMMLRKSVLLKIGGLDEAFFMYGEDIDLSYRITKTGFRNVYFSETSIIHFKGESTKKSSVNYVLVFYRAMIIFARKHFSYQNAKVISLLIHLAVYLRAFVAIVRRVMEKIYMPLIDITILYFFLQSVKWWYESSIIKQTNYYGSDVEYMVFPIMISIWIIGQLFFAGYSQPVKMKNIFKGILFASLLIFTAYSMLDESYRFSRGIVVITVLGSFLIIPFTRLLISKLRLFKLRRFSEITAGVIGSSSDIQKVNEILSESSEKNKISVYINPILKSKTEPSVGEQVEYKGNLTQLKSLIEVYGVEELIFCLRSVEASTLINSMNDISAFQLNIFLKPAEGNFLLRSVTYDGSNEYIIPETNPEISLSNLRKKRLTEMLIASTLLISAPLTLFLFKSPVQFIRNMINVILNKLWLTGTNTNAFKSKQILILVGSEISNSHERHKKKIDYLLKYDFEKEIGLIVFNFNFLDKTITY